MRHEIASTVGATAGVTAEVAQDPTVGLSYEDEQAALNEEMPCCTMCGMPIMCLECGEQWAPGFGLEAEDGDPDAQPLQEDMMGEDDEAMYEDITSDEEMEDGPP